MTSLQRVAILALLALVLTETARSDTPPDPSVAKVIEEYCSSITDLAAEQRAARQASSLKELQAKVEERLDVLEEQTEALAGLIKRREALRNLADRELVDIYAGVDAEAAAAQMEKLDLRLASSVLRQLKPRQASAILNVMKPDLAANLVRLIAVAASNDRVTQ